MANRTVKLMGYTNDTSTVTFTFNGTQVFNGVITPIGDSSALAELFSFDIDQTVNGNISGILDTTGGAVTVVGLSANHSLKVRGNGTTEDGDSFTEITSDDVDNNYISFNSGANTSKINITIDGEVYDKGDISDLGGAWHIEVLDGQSMTCDWVIESTPLSTP